MIVAWESGTAFRALYSLFLSLSTGSPVYFLVLFLPTGKTKAQRCWATHTGSHSQQEAQQGCELRLSSFISGSLLEIGTLFEPSLWWKLLVPSASCRKTGSVKVAWGQPGLPSASSKAEEAEDGVIGGTKSRPPPVKRVQMSLVTPGRQEWKSCGPAVALLEVYPMKTPMEVKLYIWDVLEASRVTVETGHTNGPARGEGVNSQHTFAGEYTWVWVQILTATFKYLEREDLRGEKGKRYLLFIGPSPRGLLSFITLSSPQTREVWLSAFNEWRTWGSERWSNLWEITQHFPGRAGMRARSCVLNHPALVPLGLLRFPCFCKVNWSPRIIPFLAISGLGGARENRDSLFYLKGK